MRFKLYGAPLKLKEDAVPRIFDCQIDRKRAATNPPRRAYKKLKTTRPLNEMLADKENSGLQKGEEIMSTIPCHQELAVATTTNSTVSEHSPVQRDIIMPQENAIESSPRTSGLNSLEEMNKSYKLTANKDTQVSNLRTHFRSKGVSCQLLNDCTASTSIRNANVKYVDSANSPIKLKNKATHNLRPIVMATSETSSATVTTSGTSSATVTTSGTSSNPTVSEYHPSSGEVKEQIEECDAHCKREAVNMTNYFISCDPKRYIGIPMDWLWILDHLHKEICMSIDDIKLTLTKIRLNDTFVRLGYQFGISSTQASKIFNKCVIKLANVLKTFIYFSDKESVKRTLPIPFRVNYSDVVAIIDAFEIQIEKPSNPVHQALTWSEYKKCNTIKYLISSSPDGKINFISKGYGGRISDCVLFEECGIMDKIPENSAVMADRGFKQIDYCIIEKKL